MRAYTGLVAGFVLAYTLVASAQAQFETVATFRGHDPEFQWGYVAGMHDMLAELNDGLNRGNERDIPEVIRQTLQCMDHFQKLGDTTEWAMRRVRQVDPENSMADSMMVFDAVKVCTP
jgi:hypothetical protein